MTHSHNRKNSRNHYFRMDVPKDIQHLVGKTSWQHSLDTTDQALADARRASYAARYKLEIIRLRSIAVAEIEKRAAKVVDEKFAELAKHYGSMDRAVAGELASLAWTVRGSWSLEDAIQVEREIFGEAISDAWEYGDGPIGTTDAREQSRIKLSAAIFEGHLETIGLVYQKLAKTLLESEDVERLSYQVGCMAYYSNEVDIDLPTDFLAVARAYLRRLVDHQFSDRPADLEDALGWAAGNAAPSLGRTPLPAAPAPSAPAFHTVQDAFSSWKAQKGILEGTPHKTADEFATALERFEQLCGTIDIAAITPQMVKSFRRSVAQLPYRPRKEIKTLPLTEQIAIAHKQRLPTLSPPTVGKHIAGLRAVLGAAIEEGWIDSNPAAGVTVEGARWEGTERQHFSEEDMRRIYMSPLMTDPDACRDTMFWILFLAPFHGSRPGEHCKLKPHEIVRDGGEWLIRIRADRRPRKVAADAPVTRPRRQKTKSSIRDIPLHWIVEESGFLDFVRIQRQRGTEWLFDDLEADKYGDRYKYLSREINDALRAVGISDPDQSFYSTRHTMKREGRRQRIVSQNLDQINGHTPRDVGSRYGQGVPAEILKEDIDRLEFRSVEWDPVVQCAQARVARFARAHGMTV